TDLLEADLDRAWPHAQRSAGNVIRRRHALDRRHLRRSVLSGAARRLYPSVRHASGDADRARLRRHADEVGGAGYSVRLAGLDDREVSVSAGARSRMTNVAPWPGTLAALIDPPSASS